MKPTHLISAATLLGLVTAFSPAAAHADSYTRSDPGGDVVKAVFDPDGSVVQPSRTDGDIVRSAVRHGPHRIRMTLRLRAIARSAGEETIYDFRIGTRTRVREAILTAQHGSWQGRMGFYDRRGNTTRCHGVRWSIGYARDLVVVSVPRRCLGRPPWVHVGMGVATLVGSAPDLYSDDAMTDAQDVDPLRWGPRVHR